jgi:O-succinylbenzoate synthase
MRIESITLTWVRVPLVEAFRISSGSVSEKDAIVVRVEGEGLTGWGESSPMAGSFYSSDTPESCWSELCDVIVPAVLHRELSVGDELPGTHFASVGIETALWDVDAQRRGVPLHKLLGGTRDCVEAGLAVGLYDDASQLLRATERHLQAGYKRVKIKIARGSDVELVRAMRGAFGNDLPLMVDANGDYTLEHLDVFRRLDEFHLMMIEQPLAGPMLEESAELQRQLRTPMCLDESLENLAAVERAIALGSFRIANIKIQRVGGFGNALRIYNLCLAHKLGIWIGTMPELGIGQAQGAALSSLPGCAFPTDVEASARWFRDDIIDPWIEVGGGTIAMPTEPGLGYRVDTGKLARYKVRERTFAR